MASGEGYVILKRFIDDNIQALESRLFNEDMEKEEFDGLKMERKAYKSVLDFVERRVKKISQN
jgi:hypothetical protein